MPARIVIGTIGDILFIARDTWKRMRESDVQILASSLAFATVISLVPLLAVSLSVFHAYGGFEGLIAKIEPFILQNLVDTSGAQASRYIRKAIKRVHSGTLGIGGAIGLLFASTKLFHDMETAVQRVWQLRPRRSLIRRVIVYWTVMFLGPLLLAALLGLIGSRDLGLIEFLPKGAIAVVFGFAGLVIIYKLVPACRVNWRPALISASVATVGIALAQEFYSVLTTKILRYSKVYGSLASIPIFLIWVLLLWWICLAGAALTATLQQRRIT